MKTLVKILLGVVLFFVLVITAVFYFTSGLVDTADAFFTAVKQKDIVKARSYLAEDFKASTDEKALTEFLTKGAILDFKEASWSNRHISGGRGELDGSITTESGGAIPIKMVLVKEKDAWKIYAIQKPTAGLQSSNTAPTIPGPTDQVALVKQSMHDFLVSIEKKDMTHFRSTVSALWQKQHTTEKLNQAFKPIMDANANWTVLENFAPILSSEPTLDADGVLSIKGHYPTKPSKVYFEQTYIYEGLAWKLIGFNIEAKST